MIKNREQFATICLVGFVCFLLFIAYVLKEVHWFCLENGDKATWVGSVVACLALIAAIVAAYLSWCSADKQNENSTIISILSISCIRSEQVGNHFISMEKIISNFFQSELDNFKFDSYISINCYSSAVVDVAREMSHIKINVSRTIALFKAANISDSSRKNLVEDFFSFIPYFLICECFTKSATKIFFDYLYDEWGHEKYQEIIENIQGWKISYETDVSYIRNIILEYSLFPELTKVAREHNLL